MVNSIKNAGGTNIKYTEIAGGGHNIWAAAAKTAGLVDWIFSKTNPSFDNTLRGNRAALATPANLAWNENVASFDAVNGARAYRLTVYVDGVAANVYEITGTSQTVDISNLGAGDISFTVTALASNLASNINSLESAAMAYDADPMDYMDYNSDGEITFEDAFGMLKACLNQEGGYNLLSVVRVLKYLAA